MIFVTHKGFDPGDVFDAAFATWSIAIPFIDSLKAQGVEYQISEV